MLIVLKYGGNAMSGSGDADTLLDDVARRVRVGDRVVLIHGGGPQIDAALAERGIGGERVAGLRVTDEATLAVTESVLCGTLNKALVRALSARGVSAVGLSGQDGSLLVARQAAPIGGRPLGFVGDIVAVRPLILSTLLAAGFLPVIAPLAVAVDGKTAFNVNADIAAGAIAGALGADVYVVVTNVDRVRRVADDPASGMQRLSVSEARAYLADGIFDGGMRPKMQAAIEAVALGARSAIITGAGAKSGLARALAGDGTVISAD